jgi:hypothetical protein
MRTAACRTGVQVQWGIGVCDPAGEVRNVRHGHSPPAFVSRG